MDQTLAKNGQNMAQTFRKWHKINQICENGGERKIFPSANPGHTSFWGERGGLVVNFSDSGSRGRGFEPHSGQTVLCSLSKAHLLPKSTGNTQEAVAPSQHD